MQLELAGQNNEHAAQQDDKLADAMAALEDVLQSKEEVTRKLEAETAANQKLREELEKLRDELDNLRQAGSRYPGAGQGMLHPETGKRICFFWPVFPMNLPLLCPSTGELSARLALAEQQLERLRSSQDPDSVEAERDRLELQLLEEQVPVYNLFPISFFHHPPSNVHLCHCNLSQIKNARLQEALLGREEDQRAAAAAQEQLQLARTRNVELQQLLSDEGVKLALQPALDTTALDKEQLQVKDKKPLLPLRLCIPHLLHGPTASPPTAPSPTVMALF